MPIRMVALAVGSLAAVAHVGTAQSFTFCVADAPRRNFAIVYYDADFLFASRHYGSQEDRGGNTRPGFFVHSKAHNQWIELKSISTKDGRFGKSASDVPEENARFLRVSVSWDFTGLAAKPYAELPLRTSGSIELPDSIAFEPTTGRYMLDFMPSWRAVPSAVTELRIRRSDLVEAFAGLAHAERCAWDPGAL
jgi:hypothetical protein